MGPIPAQHYSSFPLALDQILRQHAIPEFHPTTNSGKWDCDHSGYPGKLGVGSEVELGAWMAVGASKVLSRLSPLPPPTKLINER